MADTGTAKDLYPESVGAEKVMEARGRLCFLLCPVESPGVKVRTCMKHNTSGAVERFAISIQMSGGMLLTAKVIVTRGLAPT